MTTHTKISRQDLYERVWATPMSLLAREFGVSDVGLAKICERHDIPRPKLGHWAKKQHGKKVKQAPLIPSEPVIIEITATDRPAPEPPLSDPELIQRVQAEADPVNVIQVPETLARPHPLIKATKAAIRGIEVDRYDQVHPAYGEGECHFDLAVSKEQVDRALRILDALVRALERRGGSFVPHGDSWRRRHAIELMGQRLQLRLRERTQQVRHEPTPEELEKAKKYSWSSGAVRKWDHAPTGRLILELLWEDRVFGRIADTKDLLVEMQLNQALIMVFRQIERSRIVRRDREAAEQQRREEERRRLDLEQAERLHRARLRLLHFHAELWRESRLLKQYTRAFRAAAEREVGSIQPDSKLAEWLGWAERAAARLEPFSVVSVSDLVDDLSEVGAYDSVPPLPWEPRDHLPVWQR